MVKKETILKLSTVYITLFLTMISFFVFFNHKNPVELIIGLVLLFLIFLIFTFVNLMISLRSVGRTESLFQEQEQIFEKISNMSSQGIFLTNDKGIIIDVNLKAQSYFYEDKSRIVGKSIYRNLDCNLKNSKKTRTVFYNDLGSHFQAESQIKAIDFEGKKHYVIFLEDQTKRINEENILKKMANEDPLTGLLNRRSFINELNKEVERSSRIGLTCTIVMIDLDHFKNINDTYGHDFGDEVLVAFAGILKANSRQLDILCRYGGEEFLLLLPHTTLESSMHFLDRIKREFAEYHYSFQIKPTFSGGAINTEIKDGSVDVNLLLKEVDTLLYKAKNSGRNKIETKGHSFKLIKVS
jgi:diguanylate cyclase (GGDEF)-like protein